MVNRLWQYIRSFSSVAQPPKKEPITAQSGGQQLRDPTHLWGAKDFYKPLSHDKRLDLYYALYRTQPLFFGAVSLLCRLCLSRAVFKSGNAEVDRRCKQIWTEVQGSVALEQQFRQGLIFGFGIAENCYDSKMTKVVVPFSPHCRFVVNDLGDVTGIKQLYGKPNSDPIPARKCSIWTRDPESSFDPYGRSLVAGSEQTLQWLAEVLQAEVSIIFRAGSPRLHWVVNDVGLTTEELERRLELVRQAAERIMAGNASDLFSAPADVKVVGGETLGVRVTEEVRCLIQNFLAAVGLPAPLLNVVTQASGSGEAFIRQQVVSLQSMLDTIQDSICAAWNNGFWKIAAQLEGFPVPAVLDLENVRLAEALLEEQSRQLKYLNDRELVVAGVRDEAWFASQCGADSIADKEAMGIYMTALRSMASIGVHAPDAAAANKTQQTKTTDVRASTSTSK